MSPPVGATGIQTCNDPEGGAGAEPFRRYRVGAAFGAFSSTLKLDGHDVDIAQKAVTSTFDVRTSDRLTLQGGLGAILAGTLKIDGRAFDILPGWLFSVGAAYRVVDGEGAAPFVLGSVSYAMSFAQVRQDGLSAAPKSSLTTADLRIGVVVGKTFFQMLSPYVVGRVFEGPVRWSFGDGDKLTGGDKYHYQVGAGVSLLIARRVDLFVEGVPLGERRYSFGAGFSF